MEIETNPLETLNLPEIIDEFSRELKDSTAWNQEKKDFSWNTSSTQKVSMECLDLIQSDQNVTNTSKMKVVDILNGLFEINFQNEQQTPYKGPRGITEWIFANLVSRIKIQGVLNWFQKHSNKHPYDFYQRYLLVTDFIDYCAIELRIDPNSVDKTVLSDPQMYTSYGTKFELNEKKSKLLGSLYRQFNPFSKVIIPKTTKTIAQPFCHPLVELHLQILQKNGRTRETINDNKRSCCEFLKWLCKNYVNFSGFNINDIPLHLIQNAHLLEYRLYLKRQVSGNLMDDKNASTQFYYLRSLFRSLHQLALLKCDVAYDIKGLTFDDYHYREIPSTEEIQRFFNIVRIFSPEPSKHLLIYSLMLYLGLRISEATSLSWDNFNQSTWNISFKGKEGENSIMPIPEPIKVILKKYPDVAEIGSLTNKPISFQKRLYEYHRLYCLIAGWSFENIGFHLFRHTYITRLSEHPQCTPKLLMRLARHVKPASTSKYIHRSNEKLRQAAEKIDYSL